MAASLVVMLLACAAIWVARCLFALVRLVTAALRFAKASSMPTRFLAP